MPLGYHRDADSACDGCGRGGRGEPPSPGSKEEHHHLSACCGGCKMACYHDRECQMRHWKSGHKEDCASRRASGLLSPLQDLLDCSNGKWNDVRDFLANYYQGASREELELQESNWATGLTLWRRRDYIDGMWCMQMSLSGFMRGWDGFLRSGWKATTGANGTRGDDDGTIDMDAPSLISKRLLFLSYCEADGDRIGSARIRLVSCIAIALCAGGGGGGGTESSTTASDAFHELVLSYEEERGDGPFRSWCARQVAHIAIHHRNLCGWIDPYQRPGYMTPRSRLIDDDDDDLQRAYFERSRHPSWCAVLEDHWEKIRDECLRLMSGDPRSWSGVGSVDGRDSGHTDHRVVGGDGGRWTELVLFGTGEIPTAAPFTRRLVASHVPDAVSLARMGGGEVIFSRLAPGTHIQSHCGPTDLRLTAHLGLAVPSTPTNGIGEVSDARKGRCRIRVRNEWHTWQQGKMLLFDDSFEHEVRNDTDEERLVLLLRFWHPKLDARHRRACLDDARQRKGEAVDKRYYPPTAMFPGY